MPIQILPDSVASQIAAGEVVERPASVVKELFENSIDAEAKAITIHIQEAGRKLIEITDDGAGINESEIELALSRHATSKLRSAEDLQHIETLGFRGEALASIASVSRFTLASRSESAEMGAQIIVDSGKIQSIEKVGLPAGTIVRVRDLFFNVPARLKFLKTDATERRRINEFVTRYAIAYPDVRIQLFQEQQTVLRTSGSGNRREVLSNLYGVDTAKKMLELQLEEENIRLTGFTSPVALTRSNRKEMTFFVNGRWVQDPALSSALLRAYRTLLMVSRYPLCVIFIDMDPAEVDVNVHPAKAEVRFRQSNTIFSVVQRAVRRALLAYSPVPEISSQKFWQNVPIQRSIDPAWDLSRQGHATEAASDTETSWEFSFDDSQPAPEPHSVSGDIKPPSLIPQGNMPLLRLIGQLGATYLVAEGPDGLYLIDQHAAHERVLFEKFLKQRETIIPSQALLEPVVVQLTPADDQILGDKLDVLNKLGFQVESFGPNTYQVRAIPAFLSGMEPAQAVRSVVEDFEEDETPLQDEIEAKIIARVCKRAAVKAGQTLSKEEQSALIRDLEASQSPRTCPHGRPTMIHLTVGMLEKQFGRTGSL
ncbi:MAG: DNA mismatch repair endonuclease MutL [Anaerolineaceae bacterium]|nr:DNA mismatch repair endonuclease MutL [Anaerolineaceae bacterium]